MNTVKPEVFVQFLFSRIFVLRIGPQILTCEYFCANILVFKLILHSVKFKHAKYFANT